MSHSIDENNPIESFKAYLAQLLRDYKFDVQGIILNDGTIQPLPSESALVGKVLEISIKHHLERKLLQGNVRVAPASSDRTYPDFTLWGPALGNRKFAVDMKCARRGDSGLSTRSAISIGTFNAKYFRTPDIKVGNIMAPYSSFDAHLAIVALYDYQGATAKNVELLVVEKWRVARRKRASTTRAYIAAVSQIDLLRSERGEFTSEEEFNEFWRSYESIPRDGRDLNR
jgi:hypothetical protein